MTDTSGEAFGGCGGRREPNAEPCGEELINLRTITFGIDAGNQNLTLPPLRNAI